MKLRKLVKRELGLTLDSRVERRAYGQQGLHRSILLAGCSRTRLCLGLHSSQGSSLCLAL